MTNLIHDIVTGKTSPFREKKNAFDEGETHIMRVVLP